MGRPKGIEWSYVSKVPDTDAKFVCNYCDVQFGATSATRVRDHFCATTPCQGAPSHVVHLMKKLSRDAEKRKASAIADSDDDCDTAEVPARTKKLKQQTIITASQKALLQSAQTKLARFLYAEGVALVKADSTYLEDTIQEYVSLGRSG